MTSKLERRSIKSSQSIARKSGKYSSTTEANKAGKKSAKSVHEIMQKANHKRSGLRKHPSKHYPSGMLKQK